LDGTAPYGWSGNGKDLRDHLGHTFDRLGGGALQGAELAGLLAYLGSLAPPPSAPAPSRDRAALVARGHEAFASSQAGGPSSPRDAGAPDGRLHDVGTRTQNDRSAQFDTPMLRFLAGRAPYLHDGRFATLTELLQDKGLKMGHLASLSPAEVDALAAYLETQ